MDFALRAAGGGALAPDARKRLERYLEEVALWSERIHLVGKSKMQRNLDLLMLDSLLLWEAAKESVLLFETEHACRVADIGAGAGFPGIVWKVVVPTLEVTLFERKTKAHLFLERVISLLGLEGIKAVGDDASASREMGVFNLAVSKASGRLNSVLPLAERLLIPGGAYVTIKGGAWERELPGLPRGAMRLVSAKKLPEKRGFALVFRRD